MGTNIQVALGVAGLILIFAPAGLLIIASIKVVKSMGDFSAVLIATGAVILTIVSLDFLYNFVIALLFGPEELAAFSLFGLYFFRGLNYLALLLIGVGLLRFSNRAKSLTVGNQAGM